jgi:hypothetical protein
MFFHNFFYFFKITILLIVIPKIRIGLLQSKFTRNKF